MGKKFSRYPRAHGRGKEICFYPAEQRGQEKPVPRVNFGRSSPGTGLMVAKALKEICFYPPSNAAKKNRFLV
jgi:hypothetical protein